VYRDGTTQQRRAEDVYAYIRSRGALYGTAADIEERVGQFIDAGCGGFIVFCNPAPSAYALEQLAAIPSVRRAIEVRNPVSDG
jgi:alkanesulfonate monooxygenase SsuD/methylene tetrahydromethanopterin reductase-like flavin-dependent oxidoreductase (luciferase family)